MISLNQRLVASVTLLSALMLFPGTGSALPPQYVTQWGSLGSGPGQFRYPEGLAVDAWGNVYVSDSENARIQKFDNNGAYLGQWGTLGTGNGQFNFPDGVACDAAGNVYVVDCYNSRVQKFASDGAYLTQWGSLGDNDWQFDHPRGIAVDVAGNVFVADQSHNRILKFDADGAFLAKWPAPDDNGALCLITTNAVGDVYASNCTYLVRKFSAAGTHLFDIGSYGTGDGQFRWPCGLAVDASGNLWATDMGNDRIQEFDAGGQWLASWGSSGSGVGQFSRPLDIAIDRFGSFFVLDTNNNRVQKFISRPTPARSTSWGRLKAIYR